MVPAETVDAKGGVLLPGLIDCHIHLTGTDELVRMTQYGVTTAFDMATWPDELLKSLRGQKGLTDIKGCGLPAIGPGSSHTHMPGMPKEAVISNPEEAKKFVEDRVAEGADYIKLVSDTPGPDQESINALVRTAHDKGKVVFAHAVNLEATRMAQMAGVDIITHAPLDGVMNDDEVRQMVENKLCLSDEGY
ncbi:amidohydrolase [Gregarina niphandrodes]|uniref:Amidohydrolase n=1 Tax=Gregarina niphandrodes TaxID=110365 RepID=A0A023AV70_GRENI|nr:amidohydrolase [Gregarina niphandrodes]EZG42674.1 amidohydrolase [Gregarina niphandrodes]|eukprot:XP_011134691.1 amidohydrolase [Gregarina niphandrodes]